MPSLVFGTTDYSGKPPSQLVHVSSDPKSAVEVEEEVYSQLNQTGKARVIVSVHLPPDLLKRPITQQKAAIHKIHSAIFSHLTRSEFELISEYDYLGGFAGTVYPAGLKKLMHDHHVKGIGLNGVVHAIE